MRLNIVFGGVMAVLIVFVFMRDWRSTLITALALPTSVIATFFFIWAAGFSLNMMTLMAISLVIGILIDDAVVVRENIYRHMEAVEPMTAARKGTAEIGLAVMATTFTILAVFLPVGFMTGLVGQFFKSFALTVAFAVAMSLVIAFTLDPMLSSRFVRYVPPKRVRTRMGRLLERWGHAYDRSIASIQGAALGAGASVQGRGGRAPRVRGQSLHVVAHRHRVRAQRGPRRVRRDGRPAAGMAFDETVKSVSEVERVLLDTPEVRQVFDDRRLAARCASHSSACTPRGRTSVASSSRTSKRICGRASSDPVCGDQGRRSRVHAGGALRAADQRACAATT